MTDSSSISSVLDKILLSPSLTEAMKLLSSVGYCYKEFAVLQQLLVPELLPILVVANEKVNGIIEEVKLEGFLYRTAEEVKFLNSLSEIEASFFLLFEKGNEDELMEYDLITNPIPLSSSDFRIFVSVASYRDPELLPTLLDMYEKAENPQLVRTFCLMQIDERDEFNIQPDEFRKYNLPVELAIVDIKHSKGVCWARRFVQKQFRNEDFILQIDSHMRFAQGWDVRMEELLIQTKDTKGIISCYPPQYTPGQTELKPLLVKTVPDKFADNHTLILKGHALDTTAGKIKTNRHQWISAGYFFTFGIFYHEIPYDARHYFQGEETDLTLRAYTRGWNSYAPEQCLIWHYYYVKAENERVLHWDDANHWGELSEISDKRILHKLHVREAENPDALMDIIRYEMGKERSIVDFENEIGVIFKNKSINTTNNQADE